MVAAGALLPRGLPALVDLAFLPALLVVARATPRRLEEPPQLRDARHPRRALRRQRRRPPRRARRAGRGGAAASVPRRASTSWCSSSCHRRPRVPDVHAQRHGGDEPPLQSRARRAHGGRMAVLTMLDAVDPDGPVAARAPGSSAPSRSRARCDGARGTPRVSRSSGSCTLATPGHCRSAAPRARRLRSCRPGSLAMHALTVGAIGTLTLGMMARVALGHTGVRSSPPGPWHGPSPSITRCSVRSRRTCPAGACGVRHARSWPRPRSGRPRSSCTSCPTHPSSGRPGSTASPGSR